MAQDFSIALRAEIAELESALSADLRYKRLQELRRVLALYPPPPPQRAMFAGGGEPEVSFGTFVTRTQSGRKTSPERAKALEVAKMFLANRVGPTPTRDIYDHIISLGLSIQGEVPVNNLSAMLSNSEDFLSHGRVGWTLRGKDDLIPDSVLRDTCELVLAELSSERIREIYAGMVESNLTATDRASIAGGNLEN